MMYLKGQSVPQSSRDAEQWIRQSAAKGYGPAISWLKQLPPEK
jgi:TPR repeat protein